FWCSSDTKEDIHSRVRGSSRDGGRDITITDQLDTSTSGAHFLNEFFMTRTIQNNGSQVRNAGLLHFGQTFEVFSGRLTDIQGSAGLCDGSDLQHIAIRGVQHIAWFRDGHDGDRFWSAVSTKGG